MKKTLSGCLRELKNKEKVQLGKPKSGCGRLLEQWFTRTFHYKVEVTIQRGFHKGGRN